MAEDAVHQMDYLGLDKAHVIDDTLGGAIGLMLTYRHPERVHTVTCCQSTFKLRGVPDYIDYYRLVEQRASRPGSGPNATRTVCRTSG
jgi:pimeloyl-ACP methyl ester carboxylesterase